PRFGGTVGNVLLAFGVSTEDGQLLWDFNTVREYAAGYGTREGGPHVLDRDFGIGDCSALRIGYRATQSSSYQLCARNPRNRQYQQHQANPCVKCKNCSRRTIPSFH